MPIFVDGSKKELPYGVMVMEFLEGSALDYRKNLMEAAECLADIHSVPVKETDGLISSSNPLQAILDECNQMVQTYYESDLGEEKKKYRSGVFWSWDRRRSMRSGIIVDTDAVLTQS